MGAACFYYDRCHTNAKWTLLHSVLQLLNTPFSSYFKLGGGECLFTWNKDIKMKGT